MQTNDTYTNYEKEKEDEMVNRLARLFECLIRVDKELSKKEQR